MFFSSNLPDLFHETINLFKKSNFHFTFFKAFQATRRNLQASHDHKFHQPRLTFDRRKSRHYQNSIGDHNQVRRRSNSGALQIHARGMFLLNLLRRK